MSLSCNMCHMSTCSRLLLSHHMSRTRRFTALDTRCLEKREILTVSELDEFDVVSRFRETIPTVKSVLSSEI